MPDERSKTSDPTAPFSTTVHGVTVVAAEAIPKGTAVVLDSEGKVRAAMTNLWTADIPVDLTSVDPELAAYHKTAALMAAQHALQFAQAKAEEMVDTEKWAQLSGHVDEPPDRLTDEEWVAAQQKLYTASARAFFGMTFTDALWPDFVPGNGNDSDMPAVCGSEE